MPLVMTGERPGILFIVLLLSALVMPDSGLRLVYEPMTDAAVRQKIPGDDLPDRTPPGDKEQEDGEEKPNPLGQIAPQPAPLEQFQRSVRISPAFKTVVRPVRRHAFRVLWAVPGPTRIDRVVTESRCDTVSFTAVATSIRSHAPPLLASILYC